MKARLRRSLFGPVVVPRHCRSRHGSSRRRHRLHLHPQIAAHDRLPILPSFLLPLQFALRSRQVRLVHHAFKAPNVSRPSEFDSRQPLLFVVVRGEAVPIAWEAEAPIFGLVDNDRIGRPAHRFREVDLFSLRAAIETWGSRRVHRQRAHLFVDVPAGLAFCINERRLTPPPRLDLLVEAIPL